MKRIFILLTMMMLIVSCGYSGKTGRVTLIFDEPASLSKAAGVSTPDNVSRISVTVHGSDMDKIGPLSVDPLTNTITFEVPAGNERKFDAKAYNSDDTLIYQGSTTARINAGADNVITITMRSAMSDVTSLIIAAGDGELTLSWNNPSDSEFEGVTVMRKTGSSSVDEYDGVLVYYGSAETFTDKNLTNGTAYFYTVFACDTSGNFSVGVSGQSTPVLEILFFRGYDSTHGIELWKTDGTVTGTALVKNIAEDTQGPRSSDPLGFIYFNGKTYFSAGDATYGNELWVSDGTEAGTVMLKDILPGVQGSSPSNFIVYQNKLFFSAAGSYDTSSGYTDTELWVTDGTAKGTVLVKDINTTLVSGSETVTYPSSPSNFIIFNNKLYFSAAGSYYPTTYTFDTELWVTDGTSSGTVQVANINTEAIPETAVTSGSFPSNFTIFNNRLYFTANQYDSDLGSTKELWVSDGVPVGSGGVTEMVVDIYPVNSDDPSNLTVYNNRLYFSAYDAAHGSYGPELWVTDGTAGGTSLVKDINTLTYDTGSGLEYYGSNPANLTVFNNLLYFAAYDAINNREIWSTSGSEAGTNIAMNINPVIIIDSSSTYGSNPNNFTIYNGRLYFTADDGTNGIELWSTNGTEYGYIDLNAGSNGTNSFASFDNRPMTVYKGKLYFYTGTTYNDGKFWVTDGTLNGTIKLADAEGVASK